MTSHENINNTLRSQISDIRGQIKERLDKLTSELRLLTSGITGEIDKYNFPVLSRDGIYEDGVITLRPRPHYSIWTDIYLNLY